MDALAEISAERKRQIESEGWTPEHDDGHSDGSLARAAACYALPKSLLRFFISGPVGHVLDLLWPIEWGKEWFKPKDRRRDLIRAGALIVAEIERMDRATAKAEAA